MPWENPVKTLKNQGDYLSTKRKTKNDLEMQFCTQNTSNTKYIDDKFRKKTERTIRKSSQRKQKEKTIIHFSFTNFHPNTTLKGQSR